MASGHPKFGATNGVPALDIGQDGGTRAGALTARATIKVIAGPDEHAVVEHHLPQSNLNFRDVLGYTGRTITWECTLRFNTMATYATVVSEINRYLHGGSRDSGGLLAAPSPVHLRPTQLTDSDGAAMGNAILAGWAPRGARLTSPEWGVIQRATLTFRGID